MYVLGLYSDGDYFKVSLISKKRGKTRIEFIKEYKKDITNLNALKNILDKKLSFFDRAIEVVTALPTEEIFIKRISFPIKGRGKVLKALKFRLSSDPIYSEEDRCFVPMLKTESGQTEVTLYGYTKQAMQEHLDDIKTLGIDSDWVSTVSSGIERFVKFFAGTTAPFFLFHLGWETSAFYFFLDGQIKREVSFKIGLKDIVDAVQKENIFTENVDMQKMQEAFIRSIQNEAPSESAAIFFEIEKEVSKAWTFILAEEILAEEVSKVLFTGYSDLSRALKPFLPPIDFEEITITPHLEYTSTQIAAYAIEIGLALDHIISDKNTLQLGEGKAIPYAQRKKVKKSLYQYVSLLLLTGSVLFFSINLKLGKKTAELEKRVKSSVAKIEAYAGLPAKQIVYSVKDLRKSRKSLEQALNEKKQQSKMEEGPKVIPSIFDWVENISAKGSRLKQMEYTIVERPSEDSPLKDFIVEVELLFTPPKDEKDRQACLELLQTPVQGSLFDQEPEIKETSESIICKLRLKS